MSYFLIGCISVLQISAMHDIHLSRTLVHYNQENSSLEISMHIFIDDLELSLLDAGYDSLYIATNMEAPHTDDLIQDYINQHFVLQYTDEPVSLEFLGKEISDDLLAIWCYLEAPSVPKPNNMMVHNSILTELHRDQNNIVQLEIGSQKKYMLFDINKKEQQARF